MHIMKPVLIAASVLWLSACGGVETDTQSGLPVPQAVPAEGALPEGHPEIDPLGLRPKWAPPVVPQACASCHKPRLPDR